ncbi:hypothetical protein BC628DRAFT_884648 [Trametes gibbosa]|nr:hypothetical protein BC628DRAFT_884648 [Trametes gibbosa]
MAGGVSDWRKADTYSDSAAQSGTGRSSSTQYCSHTLRSGAGMVRNFAWYAPGMRYANGQRDAGKSYLFAMLEGLSNSRSSDVQILSGWRAAKSAWGRAAVTSPSPPTSWSAVQDAVDTPLPPSNPNVFELRTQFAASATVGETRLVMPRGPSRPMFRVLSCI